MLQYHVFEHKTQGHRIARVDRDYSIPTAVKDHVDVIGKQQPPGSHE